MITVKAWLQQHSQLKDTLNQPIPPASLRQLLTLLLQKDTSWLLAHSDHPLSSNDTNQLSTWLDKMIAGMPLSYITGQQAFWDLNLRVNPSTLIPRPDSEILIEVVADLFELKPPTSILDLGTGSGALALALSQQYAAAKILAVDQCQKALATARENAQLNNLAQVDFIHSDWFSHIKPQTFELIISNPPYLAADDVHLDRLKHEPLSALVAAENGLGDFIAITEQAPGYLTAGGILVFEHGWQQQQAVTEILSAGGFGEINSRQDLAGHDRVTWGRWVAG